MSLSISAYMPRILLFIIVFLSFSIQANSPLQLDKRLGLNNKNQQQTAGIDEQITELKNNIDKLAANAASFQQAQLDFEDNKKEINQKLKEASKPLKLKKNTDLSQQASIAYSHLSELKESEAALGNQVNELLQRHNLLPSVIATARQNVVQNKKNGVGPLRYSFGRVTTNPATLL